MNELEPYVYRRLQEHLDQFAVGFPATESGVEIRILKRLFTPDEADIATYMQFIPQPVEKIYRRVKKKGITLEELKKTLDTLGEKGCILYYTQNINGRAVKFYGNAFWALGMYEFQVNKLTKDFCEDVEQYNKEAFWDEFNVTKLPQLRTIPISQLIDIKDMIAPYDDVRRLIMDRTSQIAVGPCICKQEKDIMGEPCKQTEIRETCFFFGAAATMYVEKKQGRIVSKEEALEILKRAEEIGLVLQPSNSKRPIGFCCCCGCCCAILTNQKIVTDKPVQFFSTNYYVQVDSEICLGCETCLNRCQMEAIDIIDDVALVNLDRCIGCALCVSTCPSEAMVLKKKDEVYDPPANSLEYFQKLSKIKASLVKKKA
jgi:Pyruvate/2-oxoacid:ferredoxin oxidoreductase delta subunit